MKQEQASRRRKISFDEFWKAYPLHNGKIDAERAWNRLSAKDQLAAFSGIAAYRDYLQRTGANIKYAQGWLNGRRWEDEYDGGTFERPRQTACGTKKELPENASPAPPAAADALSDMETW